VGLYLLGGALCTSHLRNAASCTANRPARLARSNSRQSCTCRFPSRVSMPARSYRMSFGRRRMSANSWNTFCSHFIHLLSAI
jgi:hypothetical protein